MSDHLNQQNSRQGSGLKLSLLVLALVVFIAVIWVIFLADDGADGDFTVSTQVIPILNELADQEAEPLTPIVVPSFDVVRISRNGTGVIAGRAEPNSDVIIYAKEKMIGSSISDRNGEWVLLFDEPLPIGPTELSIVAKTQSNFEISSSDIVIVAVPDRNAMDFNNDDTGGVVAILSPRSGNGPSRVLQKPKNINIISAAQGLSIDALDYTDNGKTIVNGSATPAANIRIYLDNTYLGEVSSNEQGVWKYEVDHRLSPEEHVIRLDQLLVDGNVEVRISQPFNPFVDIDRGRATGDVIVKQGNSLWHIARKLYGSGYHYTVIFGANMETIINPNLIFPGQQLSLPLGKLQ